MERASSVYDELLSIPRKERHIVLFLDFDGTLAPLVVAPSKARMSRQTRHIVEQCADAFPTFVVSGRELTDIERLIGIPSITCAGNHGMEWREHKKIRRAHISKAALSDIHDALQVLESLNELGALIQWKGISFTVHCGPLGAAETRKVLRRAKTLLAPVVYRGRIEALPQKKILDVRPRAAHKGDFVRMILRKHPGAIGVYIGDDRTDEDAFRAMRGGFSIRVGKRAASAASFYVRSRKDVDEFLTKLLRLTKAQ